VGDYEIENNIW